MEFDGKVIKFNIYDAMKYPNDVSSTFVRDVIDPLAQKLGDHGTHFLNRVVEASLKRCDITHYISTTYDPQTTRQTKVFNREISPYMRR